MEFEEKEESQGILTGVTEPKSSSTPQVQTDDLSFFQHAILRIQGNFSEVREKSGKTKFEKSCYPV